MEDDFDWKKRIQSRMGWHRVGTSFVEEWKMVWEEILTGFTIAGFVAVLIPQSFWEALFLTNFQGQLPAWLIALENTVVVHLWRLRRSSERWATSQWRRC